MVACSDFGGCVYADACVLTGQRSRTNTVCVNGAPTDQVEETDIGCGRATDGFIAAPGQFGVCDGFDDVCDEGGQQVRTNGVCRGGIQVNEQDTQDCTRDTDGVICREGEPNVSMVNAAVRRGGADLQRPVRRSHHRS